MELKITKKVPIDVAQFHVIIRHIDWLFVDDEIEFGGKTYTTPEELFKDYPQIKAPNEDDAIILKIDVETGDVINWPKNCPYDFTDWKAVDTGTYTFYDREMEAFASIDGYVPELIGPGGYGDYLEFEIDENSHIPNWELSQEDLDAFIKEARAEMDDED